MPKAASSVPLARFLIRTFAHELCEAAFYLIIFRRVQAHEFAKLLHTSPEARA